MRAITAAKSYTNEKKNNSMGWNLRQSMEEERKRQLEKRMREYEDDYWRNKLGKSL